MAKAKSGRITLRMDPTLHAELSELAPKLGTDLNGLINILVREGLPAKWALVEEVERKKGEWVGLSIDEKIRQLLQAHTSFHQLGHPGTDREFAAYLLQGVQALREEKVRQQ